MGGGWVSRRLEWRDGRAEVGAGAMATDGMARGPAMRAARRQC